MEPTTTQILVANVKRLCDHLGWSRNQLADKADLGRSTVATLLRYKDDKDRHPGTDTVEKIATAFGLEPWLLLTPDLPAAALRRKSSEQLIAAGIGIVDRPAPLNAGATSGGSDRGSNFPSPSQSMGLDRSLLVEAVRLLRRVELSQKIVFSPEVFAENVKDAYEAMLKAKQEATAEPEGAQT
jgi:transcriptional regulator with XRE-family HTH domain